LTGTTSLEFAPGGTRRGWLESLATDAGARDRLLTILRDAPWEAWFWETPVLTPATWDRPAAFALVDSPSLARVQLDPAPFAAQLRRQIGDAVAFRNLSGDARLVVPRFGAPHFAAFVRTAPEAVAHAFLQRVGVEVALTCGSAPMWVSTSGLGVSWLHVRLDASPKYYSTRAWRDPGV